MVSRPETPDELKARKKRADGFYFRKEKFKSPIPFRDMLGEKDVAKLHVIDQIEDKARVDYTYLESFADTQYSEEYGFYKWLVLLFEPIEKNSEESRTVYFQAWLGKPAEFVLAHVKGKCQGIVIKKSLQGFETLLHVLKHLDLPEIKTMIVNDSLAFMNEVAKELPCDT